MNVQAMTILQYIRLAYVYANDNKKAGINYYEGIVMSLKAIMSVQFLLFFSASAFARSAISLAFFPFSSRTFSTS